MIYALIKNGIVENTIVADSEHVSMISGNWDQCVRIDHIGEPARWTKEGEEDVFEQPMLDPDTLDTSWNFIPAIPQPSVGWLYNSETETFTRSEE